jgi:hypothetical protein
MAGKIRITVYPLAQAASCCDPSGGASCNSGPSAPILEVENGRDPNAVLLERIREAKNESSKTIDVEIAKYNSTPDIFKAVDALNSAISNGGKKILVTPANFFTFISSTTPIIVINDHIAFKMKIPTKQEILDYVNAVE